VALTSPSGAWHSPGVSTRTAELQILREDPRCPFCHEGVGIGQPQLACNQCRAWHHQGCWAEGGGKCSSCGAGATGLEAESASEPAPLVNPVWGDAVAPRSTPSYGMSVLLILLSVTFASTGIFLFLVEWQHDVGPGLLTRLGTLLGPIFLAAFMGLGAWASWPREDDPGRLRVPQHPHPDREALEASIRERFQQSEGVFHKRGLSLHDPEGLELRHTLVLCMESARDLEALVLLLEPLTSSRTGSGTALVLAVADVSDELLATFRVNTAHGIFPGLVLRADGEQLAALADASGGQVVPADRKPRVRDVGRVSGVSLSADAVAFADGPTIPLKPAE